MTMMTKAAPAASDDARLKHLLPGMAQQLATSKVNLCSALACHDALAGNYRPEDIELCLSAAIVQAHLIRGRAA